MHNDWNFAQTPRPAKGKESPERTLERIASGHSTVEDIIRGLGLNPHSDEWLVGGTVIIGHKTDTDKNTTVKAVACAFAHNADPSHIPMIVDHLEHVRLDFLFKYHSLQNNFLRATYYKWLKYLASHNMQTQEKDASTGSWKL